MLASFGLFCWLVVAVVSGSATGRLFRSTPPTVHLTSLVKTTSVAPGSLGAIAWPKDGEGAVAVLGSGVMGHSPRQRVVPIASLTKMMTAYVVLADHPLRVFQSGPSFTMGQADVAAWVHASQNDESNVAIKKGEVLTEFQLLEALLIPSADNVADYLALWDAKSMPAFVAKMNAAARELGLASTHYADASGLDPGSRSTAVDQAVLAARLMANPVVRTIVRHPSIPFQVNGTVWNYNPALGTDGIIGVKSGFTSEAGACLATAAFRSVRGKSALVVAVALGQPNSLVTAATADEALLSSVTPKLELWRPSFSASTIARASAGTSVTPLTLGKRAPRIIAWPGLRLVATVVPLREHPATGPVVAELRLSDPIGVVATLPLVSVSSPQAAPTSGSLTSATMKGRRPGALRPVATMAGG